MDIKKRLSEIVIEQLEEATSHHKVYGKLGIVDRIRGGQVQLQKKQSEQAGYKVVHGQVVKMDPEELRNRKRSARIAARKRRSEMAQILRRRLVSLKKRESRFGAGA